MGGGGRGFGKRGSGDRLWWRWAGRVPWLPSSAVFAVGAIPAAGFGGRHKFAQLALEGLCPVVDRSSCGVDVAFW